MRPSPQSPGRPRLPKPKLCARPALRLPRPGPARPSSPCLADSASLGVPWCVSFRNRLISLNATSSRFVHAAACAGASSPSSRRMSRPRCASAIQRWALGQCCWGRGRTRTPWDPRCQRFGRVPRSGSPGRMATLRLIFKGTACRLHSGGLVPRSHLRTGAPTRVVLFSESLLAAS